MYCVRYLLNFGHNHVGDCNTLCDCNLYFMKQITVFEESLKCLLTYISSYLSYLILKLLKWIVEKLAKYNHLYAEVAVCKFPQKALNKVFKTRSSHNRR